MSSFPRDSIPPSLRDALWRLSHDEQRPVLRRLPHRGLERGDRDSRADEPDPLTAELRARLAVQPELAAAPPAEPQWWQVAYRGGGPAKLEHPHLPRPLYPPDAEPAHPRSTNSGDVVAYKRTISRLGRWPWQKFSEEYSDAFAIGKGSNGMVGSSGTAGVQRQQKISPAWGWIGEPTFQTLRYCLVPEAPGFEHAGAQAMDAVACNLLDEAWQLFNDPPANVDDVRAAIADFCKRSIIAAGPWHYEQYRAMRYLGVSPDEYHESDCSEHATEGYYWARIQTGIAVPDPNDSGYNGYGWTGTLINNPTASSPYKIGDLAIYGDSAGATEHVCTCYHAGDANTSEWCSHGSEDAPYAVELYYRSDLVRVVRPRLTP